MGNLRVPEVDRLDLASDPRLHIELADFDEPTGPIRKQWAELAYLNLWVRQQKKENQGPYVFLASSFNFDQLEREFIALRELTRLLESEERDDEAFAATVELLKGPALQVREICVVHPDKHFQ